MPRPRAVALLLALTVAACGAPAGDDAATTPSPTVSRSAPSPTSPHVDPAVAHVADAAVADLAERLDVPPDDITVAYAQPTTWGDTSLGCPQPGQRYAQVLTEGVRVELVHDKTTYHYHAGGDHPSPFLCENPEPPPGTASSSRRSHARALHTLASPQAMPYRVRGAVTGRR